MYTNTRPSFSSRRLASNGQIILLAALFACSRSAIASNTLAYSFENDLQGFAPNGGGITVAQDTVGATAGTHSMRIDSVAGQTFPAALTGNIDPTIYGNPPGLDHVTFDFTFNTAFPGAYEYIQVYCFGVTQDGLNFVHTEPDPSSPNQLIHLDGLAPGTYLNQTLDLSHLVDPVDSTVKSFNQIFGAAGSGSDLIPTGFEFVIPHSSEAPITVYIDNVRFGTTPAGVPGDYNGNGVVDMADYVLWRNGGPLQNEVADPGTVTAADYTAWRAAFGNHSGSGSGLVSSAVPEPSSILLLSAAAAIFAARRTSAAR